MFDSELPKVIITKPKQEEVIQCDHPFEPIWCEWPEFDTAQKVPTETFPYTTTQPAPTSSTTTMQFPMEYVVES